MAQSNTIAERYQQLCQRLDDACSKCGRNPEEVQLVAVSKKFSSDAILEAYEAGARVFAENYVQEALPKMDEVKRRLSVPDIEWHFIGGLQSNKAKKAVGRFDLIHSVDRWSLVRELEKAAKAQKVEVELLVELNVAGEASKSGMDSDELKGFLERVSHETEHLRVKGLMVFPPYVEKAEDNRRYFVQTREIAEKAKAWKIPNIAMDELSMGVTSDFEVAIEEGATLVRIGTALFGPRT